MSTPASDAKAEAGNTKPVSKSGVLVAVCVPLLAGVLNASAVGVVLPAIIADLEVDAGRIAWLMTGFLLVYGILAAYAAGASVVGVFLGRDFQVAGSCARGVLFVVFLWYLTRPRAVAFFVGGQAGT